MEGYMELVLNLPKVPIGETVVTTQVNSDFFSEFEDSPITEASYHVWAELDRKPGLYILTITAEGWHATTCDRCLEPIRLPGTARYQYYFQKGEQEIDAAIEDVIPMDGNETELDLRPFVYETIILSLPMVNIYDCENDPDAPCDEKILNILREGEKRALEKENPAWDVLKKIKFKD